MTQLEQVIIKEVIVHKVGNPTRGEDLKLSANPITLNDEMVRQLLTKYFLHPFNLEEQYRFTHQSDVALNEVYHYCHQLFQSPQQFVPLSQELATFLYHKSTHARVKEGELYVVRFGNIPFGNDTVEAIGIFKSETKETFLKVFPHGASWEVIQEQGVNINKLDKGCLVLHHEAAEGFVVAVVDATNKQNDAQYWIDQFLQVTPAANNYHYTDQTLGLAKLFIQEAYPQQFEAGKSDQIELMNRSLDYFKTNDQFNMDEFTQTVFHHEEVIDSFNQYKEQYQQQRGYVAEPEFDIHLSAVKQQAKSYKSVLKLDKNFHVYIHGRRDLLEKGFDEMTGKKFYKLYFDEES